MIVHVEKRFQTMCTVVKSHIQPMGAVKTVQALLSFVVRLSAGLPGICTLKTNVGTQKKVLTSHFTTASQNIFLSHVPHFELAYPYIPSSRELVWL